MSLALITGSTSGLGEEFARQLAADGYDLLLVARRTELLNRQKTELEKQYGISVEILSVDLAAPLQLAVLEQRVAQLDTLEFLVNNAGFGFENKFPDTDIDLECRMVQVHAIAPLRLSYAALGPMIRRKKGYIINVASVAAYLHGPACAQYMATKAYLLSFSKCLQCDVRDHGIEVQALCPGFVRTGFHSAEWMNEEKFKKIPDFLWLRKESVVRESLGNVRKKRRRTVCVPSWRYKFFLAILTCPLFTWATEWIYQKRAKM
ncbi:MAG: SDR family NAD(P)-dependent oxidoreductase [Planctomycetaceae bacterium]|nr:SDR family NAD(P)-dependent oxidoreductase [Planctomycetaceae bacterium]